MSYSIGRKTINGENTLELDSIDLVGDGLACLGDFGTAKQILKKSSTNQLEWHTFGVNDYIGAGYLISIAYNTVLKKEIISLDLTAGNLIDINNKIISVNLTNSAGNLIDINNNSIDVNLNKLTTNATVGQTDYVTIVLQDGSQKKILFSEFLLNTGLITAGQQVTCNNGLTVNTPGNMTVNSEATFNNVALFNNLVNFGQHVEFLDNTGGPPNQNNYILYVDRTNNTATFKHLLMTDTLITNGSLTCNNGLTVNNVSALTVNAQSTFHNTTLFDALTNFSNNVEFLDNTNTIPGQGNYIFYIDRTNNTATFKHNLNAETVTSQVLNVWGPTGLTTTKINASSEATFTGVANFNGATHFTNGIEIADNTANIPGSGNHILLIQQSTNTVDFRYPIYTPAIYTDAIAFGSIVMTLPTTGGVSGQVLTTDGSGGLSWVHQHGSEPAWFYAYDGATHGSGTYNNYTGFVPWGSTEHGSTHFSTALPQAPATDSGGYYTAPETGFYHFEAAILNYPGPNSNTSNVWFSINGSTVDGQTGGFGNNRLWNIGTQEHISASATIKLTVGDTVKVRVHNVDIYTVGHHSYFTGVLVKEL